MPSGSIKIRVRAHQGRDDTGRYLSAIETGAYAAVSSLVEEGAAMARAGAPVGKTGRTRGSIRGRMLGPLTGEITGGRGVRWFRYQEEGAGQKGRPGQFLTNRDDFEARGPVAGNPGLHFMARAWAHVRAKAPATIRAHLP